MYKIKTKPLTKTQIFLLGIAYTIFTAIVWHQFIHQSKAYFAPLMERKQQIVVEEKVVEIEQTLTDEVYMANALKEAGLNVAEAFAVVWKESRGNENAQHVNTNGTIDNGPWQINSIHIKSGSISLECAASLECSTEWSIKKRLNDGNWSAWVGAKLLGIR